MTKLEIFNIALSQHAKRCTQAELESDNPPTEVEACMRMYEMAVQDVLAESDWSFCVVPVELDTEDDEPYGKWLHGYRLSGAIIRVAKVGTMHSPYMISGGRFYTDEDDPKLWGIRWDATVLDIAPRDFCNLVGLWLGYLVSTIISPSDNGLATRILQNYSAHLQSMLMRENASSQDNYLDDDDWSAKQK